MLDAYMWYTDNLVSIFVKHVLFTKENFVAVLFCFVLAAPSFHDK